MRLLSPRGTVVGCRGCCCVFHLCVLRVCVRSFVFFSLPLPLPHVLTTFRHNHKAPPTCSRPVRWSIRFLAVCNGGFPSCAAIQLCSGLSSTLGSSRASSPPSCCSLQRRAGALCEDNAALSLKPTAGGWPFVRVDVRQQIGKLNLFESLHFRDLRQ